QRVELEYVVVVARPRRGAWSHVIVIPHVLAGYGTFRQLPLGNFLRGSRNVPRVPVQDVIGVATDRNVNVMQNDRKALRLGGRVRDLEVRLRIAAAEAVFVGHDAAVRKRAAFDQQRDQAGATTLLTLLRRRSTGRRLLGLSRCN